MEIADFIQAYYKDAHVSYSKRDMQYAVENKSSGMTNFFKRLLPKEGEVFTTKISSRRFKEPEQLVREIQRCMNPPLVTVENNKIVIDEDNIEITCREYTHEQLCKEIENKVNETKGWKAPSSLLHVSYENGRYTLERVAPFRIDFCDDNLGDILGFTDAPMFGRSIYTSHFEVFNPSKDLGYRYLVTRCCIKQL